MNILADPIYASVDYDEPLVHSYRGFIVDLGGDCKFCFNTGDFSHDVFDMRKFINMVYTNFSGRRSVIFSSSIDHFYLDLKDSKNNGLDPVA